MEFPSKRNVSSVTRRAIIGRRLERRQGKSSGRRFENSLAVIFRLGGGNFSLDKLFENILAREAVVCVKIWP